MDKNNKKRPIGPELHVHFTANYIAGFDKPIELEFHPQGHIELEFHPQGHIGETMFEITKINVEDAIQADFNDFLDLMNEFKQAKDTNRLNLDSKQAAMNYMILKELQILHPDDTAQDFDL